MHFFQKTIGLMAFLCVVPCAFAATARPGVITTTASSRIPTMVVKTSSSSDTSGTTSDGTITVSALLNNSECIDAYTACIRGADACGENFEECTTKELFHAKMPNCVSTLGQCSSSGVDTLFGRITTDKSGDIAKLAGDNYPTDGSVLGQMITAAEIANRYDTATCVRRYTSCLKKDSVCGDDFELCTTSTDFKKQSLFCESTLARCQDDGKKELFGSTSSSSIQADSRIDIMIKDGAALAAANAVNTCYKVIDQCFLNACSENPYNCTAGMSEATTKIADAIKKGDKDISDEDIAQYLTELRTNSDVAGYLRNACLSTIGTNKYCYATLLNDGKMPTNAQLRDEDNQDLVYELAYEKRMNDGMRLKIAELLNTFDEKAKKQCTDTIKSCAMRVCGGGSGPACYDMVFGTDGVKSINAKGSSTNNPYDEIKSGCEIIVDTDVNCKYAAVNPNLTGTYSYSYINKKAFDTLFPEETVKQDPIGVVAALNSSLATSYNDAAIAQMRKQCANVARACVISMCGDDYTNCYRNRTDVYSNTYGDDSNKTTAFYDSMNKVGGVLDYTVVLGLCMDTVKNSSSCAEHLAIQKTKVTTDDETISGWGTNGSVRDAWGTAAKGELVSSKKGMVAYDCVSENTTGCPGVAPCGTVNGIMGCIYDQENYVEVGEYKLNQAAETVFQEVLVDIEKEAQAKYNAKLTREQNMCLAANAGGITGLKDTGSTFMWVKLKGNRVPKGYNVNGLTTSQFAASNDLYGSFCRVRVTLQSDDKKIQDYMKNKSWTTAYFAVGDAFTCGSWIPESDLNRLAETVAQEKTGTTADGALSSAQGWAVAGATILSTIAGGVGTDMLQTKTGLGGLLKTTGSSKYVKDVKDKAKSCMNSLRNLSSSSDADTLAKGISSAMAYVSGIKGDFSDIATPYNNVAQYNTNIEDGKKADAASAAANLYNGCLTVYNMSDSQIESRNPDYNSDNFWTGMNGGRAIMDTAGAAAGGIVGGIMTHDLIKESNKAQFTAAQQEWMDKVGRHITCYIGGDEAGSYGDVITTSLE